MLHLALGVGHNKCNAVQRLHLITRLGRHAIDQYVTAIGGRLYAVTRAVLHAIDKILVQSQEFLTTIYRDGKVLEHLVSTLHQIDILHLVYLFILFAHHLRG